MILARSLGASQRTRTSYRVPREIGRRFFGDVTLRLELGNLTPQLVDLEPLGAHRPLAGESVLRISSLLANPFAQNVDMQVQITSRLRNSNAPFSDQLHSLELELAAELPSHY